MAEYRVPSTTKVGVMIAAHTDLLEEHGISGGLDASRPAAGNVGAYYFSTDAGKWSRDNGATWDEVSGLSEVYIQGLIDASITTHAALTATHGATDIADVSDIAVDTNLSATAQAAITASHTAPTYDGGTDEVVFTI